jgi:hypothetical protein
VNLFFLGNVRVGRNRIKRFNRDTPPPIKRQGEATGAGGHRQEGEEAMKPQLRQVERH